METKVMDQINLESTVDAEEKSVAVVEEQKPEEQVELPVDSVIEINGVPVTTSLKIAEVFGKPHNDVMKRVRIAEESYKKGGQGNFSQSSGMPFVLASYKNQQNKDQPMYYLTEAGFSFVVMGFTGDKAASWKWKYIAAFEAMKEELSKRNQPKPMTFLEVVAANAQALVDHERKLMQHDQDITNLKSAVSELRNPFNRSNTKLFNLDKQVDDHEERITNIEAFSEDKGPAEAVHALVDDAYKRYHDEYSYQDLWTQFYDALRDQCGIRINARVSQLKRRRREQGWSESKVKKISKLDAITASPDIWEQVRGLVSTVRSGWDMSEEG